MARRFGIDVRALMQIALPDLSAADSELSNEAKAGYLWEALSYFGCHEEVEETVRGAAREAGFNELTYDAFVRRIERALEEAGFGDFDVVRKSAHGRAMYADAQARRYTDMEIRVVAPGGSVEFHAHKCVVSSASPLLRAMIEQRGGNMVGSDAMNDVYEIREIPVDVLRVCMEFMYTGEVRVDAPMEPDFVASLVLAADRLFIADGLFPLIGRELLDEANAPRAIEAACMTHATRATRWLVDTCAVYIVRSLARGSRHAIESGLPSGAIYAVAGEAVKVIGERSPEQPDRRAEGEAERSEEGEAEKWTMRVGAAVIARTGMAPCQLHARLIETGTPANAHSGNYRATFEKINATEAPVSRGRTKMSAVPEDGKHTFVFCVGQREYVACVRRSRDSKAFKARVTVAFRSNEPAVAPQLVTVRAAGLSTHAVLVCGREHSLEIPCSMLDPSGVLSVEVEADPLFAICSEVVRLTVQQGPEAVAIVAGLDSRVLWWILSAKSRLCVASCETILREIATRPSEDDRVELTKALVSGRGTNWVSMGDITALLGRVPCLFDEDNERMLDVLVSYAVGLAGTVGNEAAREQLMGLIRCMADGIRRNIPKSVPKSKAMRIE